MRRVSADEAGIDHLNLAIGPRAENTLKPPTSVGSFDRDAP